MRGPSEEWRQAQRERIARDHDIADREILSLRDSGLTFARIATRYGISRTAARYRVLAARRRQRVLATS